MDVAFDERGLAPCVIQDWRSGEVLTLAYMNAEALARTRETGELHLWSRSRDELWRKGATSGKQKAAPDEEAATEDPSRDGQAGDQAKARSDKARPDPAGPKKGRKRKPARQGDAGDTGPGAIADGGKGARKKGDHIPRRGDRR
jgi:hypothetical protein